MIQMSALAPLLLAAGAALTALVVGRLHPMFGARLLLALLLTTTAATVAWAIVGSGGFLVPLLMERHHSGGVIGWFAAHPTPGWLGVPALAILGVGGSKTAGFLLARRTTLGRPQLRNHLSVIDDDRPLAATFPGPHGLIVLSRGLLRRLPRDEVEAVVAHEEAHRRHRHDIYSALGEIASYFCPWLRPTSAELRFLLERWADEEAARSVGDRHRVARAISRVALGSEPPRASLAFGGHHTLRRVQAMLADPPAAVTPVHSLAMAGASAAATGLASSSLQLHHAVAFLG